MHPVLERFWDSSGDRFAELMMVGGSNPGGYGIISGGGPPYLRKGLEQDEFFEFLQLNSYLSGVFDVLHQLGIDGKGWIAAKIQMRWKTALEEWKVDAISRGMSAEEAEEIVSNSFVSK